MNPALAPCGMNCELCHSFQNKKKPCPGCQAETGEIRKSCRNCIIKACDKKQAYCFECVDYPCKRLQSLDLRYRAKYNMSMLENLAYIKEYGEKAFLEQQRDRYACPDCGNLRTVHYDYCVYCK